MIPSWTWFEYTWLIAALESFLALALLLFACLALWRRLKSKLFLVASVGFFLGLVGNAFRTYVLLYSESLCPTDDFKKMGEFIACSNSYAGLGGAVAAAGLIAAAGAFLVYALRKSPVS